VSARRLAAPPLRCPTCGGSWPAGERFCARCGVPLTLERGARSEAADSERHARARKIKPQLGEGRLVRVAGARNQPEAELIASLLLEAGVPSLVRRSAGFDVPDFLAAGPRDVLVAESGLERAREVLLEAELLRAADQRGGGRPAPLALALGILAALAAGVLLIWVFTMLA